MIGRFIAAVLLALLAITAQADEAARIGEMVIETPWARASIGISRPGAAYLTIRNEGAEADTLAAITTPAAGMVQVHDTTIDAQGVARMGPTGPLEIPAGGEVVLAPGGKHVMLMKLREPLVKGGTLLLTLSFERSGTIELGIPILGLGARGPEE